METDKYEQLKESGRFLGSLINNLPGVAYRCKNDKNWTMEYISDGCHKLTGYLREDLLGNKKVSYNDLILPEYREQIWLKWQSLLSNKEIFQDEYPIRTSDGKIKWIWEQGCGVFDDRGNLIALEGFLADVTERIEIQRKLSETNKMYYQTLESIQDAFISFDNRMNCTYFNKSAEEIFEISKVDILGKNFFEVFPQAKGTIYEESFQLAVNENHLIKFEITPDLPPFNKYLSFRMYPNEKGFSLFCIDNTKVKGAEDEVSEAEEKYSAVFNYANDAILIMSDYLIIDCNQKAVEIFGIEKNEILFNSPAKLSPEFQSNGESSQVLAKHYMNEAYSGNPQRFEWLHSKGEGSVFYAEVSLNQINLRSGKFLQAIIRDKTDIKRAEDSLLKSYRDLQITLNSISDGVIATDNQGKIIRINSAAEKLTGWNKFEAYGEPLTNVFKIINTNSRKPVSDPAAEVLSTGEVVGLANHTSLIAKDGTEYNIADGAAPIKDDNGDILGVVIVFSDVSKEYKARQALRESEARFRLIAETLPVGIVIHVQGKLMYANKTMLKMIGLENIDVEQVKGQLNVLDFVHPDDQKLVVESIMQGYQNYGNLERIDPFVIEERLISTDGSIIDTEASAVMLKYDNELAMMVTINDVTEKKKHFKELEEKNTFIQSILDNLPIGIAVNYFDSGKANYLNDKFAEIYGWEKSKLIDIEQFFELVYPDEEYRKAIMHRIMDDINTGDINRMKWEDIMIRTQNNETRYINAANIPIIEQNMMVSTVQDNSFRHHYENEITIARQNALQAAQTAQTILNNLGHELRTPLNGILGFTKVLSNEIMDEECLEMLGFINNSAERLKHTLNSLLVLNELDLKKINLEAEDVNLIEIVQFYEEEKEKFINQRDIDYKTEIEATDVIVNGNTYLIDQIMHNLLDNAFKFTQNGFVKLTVSNMIDDEKKYGVIKIQDTGCGIPQEKLNLIFEPFRQAEEGFNRPFEGVGLGLTIVRKLVDILKGEIIINSVFGEGTEVILKFPQKV